MIRTAVFALSFLRIKTYYLITKMPIWDDLQLNSGLRSINMVQTSEMYTFKINYINVFRYVITRMNMGTSADKTVENSFTWCRRERYIINYNYNYYFKWLAMQGWERAINTLSV